MPPPHASDRLSDDGHGKQMIDEAVIADHGKQSNGDVNPFEAHLEICQWPRKEKDNKSRENAWLVLGIGAIEHVDAAMLRIITNLDEASCSPSEILNLRNLQDLSDVCEPRHLTASP